jgi:hypothetical protein
MSHENVEVVRRITAVMEAEGFEAPLSRTAVGATRLPAPTYPQPVLFPQLEHV